MPGRLLLFLAVLGLGTAAAADDGLKRLTLRQDLLGWEGVGRLDLAGTGYCTGVLIATDIVLTAGHCLYDSDSGTWRGAGGIVFRSGYRDGATIAERKVTQAAVSPRYDPLSSDPVERLAYDVALVQLAEPIPAATARPFRTAGRGRTDTVSVLSYGRGRDNAPSRQADCRVLGAAQGIMVFDCNGVPGSSGAPVFTVDGTTIRIVSMIVAGNGTVSYGPDLHDDVDGLLRDLRTGRGLWDAGLPDPVQRVAPGPARKDIGARFLKP